MRTAFFMIWFMFIFVLYWVDPMYAALWCISGLFMAMALGADES